MKNLNGLEMNPGLYSVPPADVPKPLRASLRSIPDSCLQQGNVERSRLRTMPNTMPTLYIERLLPITTLEDFHSRKPLENKSG
jgi:hypothetical protein